MRIAPDLNDPLPLPKEGEDKNKGNKGRNIPAFQPGQLGALASQLNAGFGGGFKAWKGDLRDTYDPTRMKEFDFGAKHGGGGDKRGGKNDPNNPGKDPNGTGDDPRPDTANPHYRMAPMTFPLGFQSEMGMQRPMAQQMPSQSQLSPEMINLIRAHMMRG